MDAAKDQHPLAERVRQRFQAYRERHNDMHSRYANNLTLMQARDMQDAQQVLQHCRTQPQKTAKTKQYESQKQLKGGTEQSDPNGGFINNNNDMMKVAHKRGYEQFNGTNGILEDTVTKMARIAENASFQQQQQQAKPNQQQQNAVRKSPFDMKATHQPNINPFQNSQAQPKTQLSSSQHQQPKYKVNTHQPVVSATNRSTPANLATTASTSNTSTVSENNTTRTTPKIENTASPASDNKNDLITSNCVSSPVNLMQFSQNQESNVKRNNDFESDLDALSSYELFGEITGNTSRKPIKSELDKTKVCSSAPNSFNQNSSQQQHPNSWKEITKQSESPPATINLNSTAKVAATINNNNPLSKLINSQHLPISNALSKISNASTTPNANINTKMTPLSSLNQMTSNVQNTRLNVATTTSDINNMTTTLMNNPRNNQLVNQQALVNKNVVNNRQQNDITTSSSLQSSNINMNITQQTALSINNSQSNVPSSYPVPPNLQRTPTLRQQIADRFKNPQQSQSPMLQNMQQNMGNPLFMQPGGPSTAAKLHGFLLKKREQERMQMQIQQQQMQQQKTPFVSHGMMSSSPMQQSPYNFTNDFNSFNQMNMQNPAAAAAAQQNIGAYYPQMYPMENGSFPTGPAPPGYNQTNRQYFGNFIRNRQMNEMYNSTIGNIRPGMNQNAMFNTPTKAPPQYQPAAIPTGLSQNAVDAQQLMMVNNTAVPGTGAMQSRLSHFSQPDNMKMNAVQMRLRPGTMNTIGRYPTPPNLSRPDNLTASNQFDNQFSTTPMNSGNMRLMGNTPTPQQQAYNSATNWSSEQQQHMLMLRKERMEAQQRQQLMNLQHQRLQQQQQMHDSSGQSRHNMLDNLSMQTNNITYNASDQTATNFATSETQDGVVSESNTNRNITPSVLPPADVSSNVSAIVTSGTGTMLTETSDSLSLLADNSAPPIDSSGIDNIIQGSADELDNFLNNPSDNFDLYSMF